MWSYAPHLGEVHHVSMDLAEPSREQVRLRGGRWARPSRSAARPPRRPGAQTALLVGGVGGVGGVGDVWRRGRIQPSTPVASWAAPTGFDSGEPRCLR